MQPFPFHIILDWYHQNGRHNLPWRLKQTPYHVWISEIFLQQTQVSRVEGYFNKVIETFPTIEDFGKLTYEDFFPYYEGLWYYSRAKNMLKTAQMINQRYHWIFPQDYQELIQLPGVWPYTAQAILAFWYDKHILAFDTNIEKIFSRYYFGTKFKKLSKLEKLEIQNMFEKTWISGRDINAALMDFSTFIDKNEKHLIDFDVYPLKESVFFLQKWENEIKPIKILQKFDKKAVKVIVFLHKDHKIYYSADVDNYMPFELEKHDGDHRTYIKKYFFENFWLSLSVRPPFKKTKTHFFYHAQIQVWESNFGEFKREEYEECMSWY